MRSRYQRAPWLVLAAIGLWSGSTAQEAASPTPAEASPQVGGAAEVVQRLDGVNSRLREINEYLRRPAPDLAGITVALPTKSREAEAVLGGAEEAPPDVADRAELLLVLEKLRSLDRIFAKWRGRLGEEIAVLDPWREQLLSDAGFMREVEALVARGTDDGLPASLRQRLEDLATALEQTRMPLRRRLDVVVAADVRVGSLQTALKDLESQLDSARLERERQPLALTAPPLWKVPPALNAPLELARQNVRAIRSSLVAYYTERPTQFAAFGAILGLMLLATYRLRQAILARDDSAGENPDTHELLTAYPIAVTVLVWVLLVPLVLLADIPAAFNLLQAALVIALLWRILPALVGTDERDSVRGLLLLALAFLGQLVFLSDDWYGRFVTVVLGAVAVLNFHRLRLRMRQSPAAPSLVRSILRTLADIAPWIIAVGIVAEALGARALGQQAIGGMVFASLALCALAAAEAIVRSVLDAWVDGPGGRWFRGVRRWPDHVRRGGRLLTRILLVLGFFKVLPRILPILEPVFDGIDGTLGAEVKLGTASLSLGTIVWFLVSIAVAIAIARFVRFVLDEDVFARLTMPPGAASAASRLIYYALVIAGILFSLAVAGVELSRLTLVISALGVGIGFGLQNIVNNFVSGLILAFERPIREGDQVTLGQTSGRVDQIGLRATRIRTGDGAEVIVPNATLIAGELINWTLSDRARRIEITVSVGSASDPDAVKALLLEAVRGLPGVAARPESLAVFRGFGAGSLDFAVQLWTDDIDDRLAVESEARGRILAALRKAGVEIPLPQMDLRVRPPGATLPGQ